MSKFNAKKQILEISAIGQVSRNPHLKLRVACTEISQMTIDGLLKSTNKEQREGLRILITQKAKSFDPDEKSQIITNAISILKKAEEEYNKKVAETAQKKGVERQHGRGNVCQTRFQITTA